MQHQQNLLQAVCLGDILMDMIPDKETEVWDNISSFSPVPGGSVANVAVGLAKLGVKTRFIGKVGQDPFGKILTNTLKKNKVDTSAMRISSEVRTTLGFACIREKGENDFLFYRNPGADMMLRPEEVGEKDMQRGRIFHFGSITVASQPSCSAAIKAARLAKKNHLWVSFDPNLRPSLWKSKHEAKKRILHIIRDVDLLKMNREECTFLAGTEDPAKGASKLLQKGPKIMILTEGEKGSFFFAPGTSCFCPSFHVEVVDTVGCGDSFTAAVICKLLELTAGDKNISGLGNREMKETLIFANATGALTAAGKGVISSLPSRQKVDEFLQKSVMPRR